MKKQANKFDQITETIIKQMETHGTNWTKPFTDGQGGLPRRAFDGRKMYRGINILMLGLCGGYWATYDRWQQEGYQVRKGEKSSTVYFWKRLEKEDQDTKEKREIWIFRSNPVFSADQLEVAGLACMRRVKGTKKKEQFISKAWVNPNPTEFNDETEIVQAADEWIEATGADVRHSAKGAAYYSHADFIHMPNRELFLGSETADPTHCYYSTFLHELTHWTGASHRLSRDKGHKFGDKKYAFEELVAELGAAFQCALLGISMEPKPDHAEYLANWLTCLKEQPKAIYKAASLAQQAVDYIDKCQPINQEEAA